MVSILAKKYAKAFVAAYKKQLTSDDMVNIDRSLRALKSNKAALAFLHLVPGACQMSHVFDRFLEHFGLDKILHGLIALLAEHKRLWLIPEILEALGQHYKESHGITSCIVTSAGDLDADQKAMTADIIAKKFGKNAEIIYRIDKRLIAGIRIQTPEVLWEHSVDTDIRDVCRSLGVVYCGN